MEKKTTYCSIDIAKIFFSICIVMLHTRMWDFIDEKNYYYITRLSFRLAVPFFFIISGYMLSKKVWDKREIFWQNLKAYLKRMFIWIIVLEPINVLFEVFKMYYKHQLNLSNALNILKNIVFYPYGALWYLQASCVAVIIIYPFFKYNKEKYLLFFSLVLYLWALACNNDYFVFENSD